MIGSAIPARRWLPLALSLLLPGLACWSQAPPRDIYWESQPVADPFTTVLWQFGSDSGAFGAELDDLLVELDKPAESMSVPGLGGNRKIEPELSGAAQVVPDGRFGDGLRLSAGGQVGSDKIELAEPIRTERGATIDFWFRRQARAAAVLAVFHGGPPLSLRLLQDGALALSVADQSLITCPRLAAVGQWYHVALVLYQDGGAELALNGTAIRAAPAAIPWATLRGGITFGSESFTGSIDAVRVRRGARMFYELHREVCDPTAARPVVVAPPYFSSLPRNTLYLSFDQGGQPDIFSGLSSSGKVGDDALVPGVRGRALNLAATGVTSLAYSGMNVLPQPDGTLELWLRPRNWDNYFVGDFLGSDVRRERLLRIAHKDSPEYLGYRVLSVSHGRAAKDHPDDLVPMHPGVWTHVLVTWTGNQSRLYLNGQPARLPQLTFQGPNHIHAKERYDKWRQRTGGKADGSYRVVFNNSQTELDELRFYPWAMQPTEVRNAYARFFPDGPARLAALPALGAKFDYYAHDWENTEKLDIALTCLPVDGTMPRTVDLTLSHADGQPIGEQAALALDASGKATASFVGHLEFGEYALKCVLHDADGRALKEIQTAYTRVRPPWYGNQLGKARTVPAPWTPIVATGHELQVWGRHITVGATGLPETIEGQGRQLLAAPVRIHGQYQDTNFSLTGGELAFTETAPDRAAWQTVADGGAVQATVAATLAYDGLMYYRVRLTPTKAPVTLHRLQVDVPLRPAIARQLICNAAGQDFRAGWDIRMIPEGEGRVWSTKAKATMQQGLKSGSYCSQIWVGNDHVGLSFSGENDQGWTIDEATPAQELRRENGQVVFRMNVISLPVDLTAERTFTFIITPTPSKPEPVGWRGWNRAAPGTPLAVYDAIDDFIGFPLKSSPDKPESLQFKIEPVSWEAAAQQQQQIHEKFGAENPVFLYIDYSWPKPGPSFADWHHDLWAGTGRIAWTVPEVEDYMVWAVNEYIRRGLIDGIYIDDVSVGRTYSLAGTAYPLPGGEPPRRQGFTFMGFRRFCERIWKLFEAQGKQPHIMPHMTLCFELPALSFCNSMVNGEARMIGIGARRDTMDRWSRDELRIMGNAPKWGIATFWKPTVEIQGPLPQSMAAWHYRQARTLHAHVMQHDLWYLWHYPTARVILPSLIEFDLTDPALKFIPYWENDLTVIDTAAADLVAGVFVKPGKALLLLSNYGREAATATVTVEPGRLFPAATAVAWRDADCCLRPPADEIASDQEIAAATTNLRTRPPAIGETDEAEPLGDNLDQLDLPPDPMERLTLEVDGNRLHLTVRKRDYRLIEITPVPK